MQLTEWSKQYKFKFSKRSQALEYLGKGKAKVRPTTGQESPHRG